MLVQDHYLLIAHRRKVLLPTLRKVYLSRAYSLTEDLSSLAAGPYFSLSHPAIQFVNGIAATEDKIYLSYGLEDHEAFLAVFDREDFLRSVLPRSHSKGRPRNTPDGPGAGR